MTRFGFGLACWRLTRWNGNLWQVAARSSNHPPYYASNVSCVLHDQVVQKQERVKINRKFKWTARTYVQIQKQKVPGAKTPLKVKSGTQITDRLWRYLKDRLNINQHSKVGSRRTATGLLGDWFMAES